MSWESLSDRLNLLEEGKRRCHKPLFMEIFMLAAWNIWKERNKLLFEGTDPTLASWKLRLKADFLVLVHGTKSTLHSYIFDIVSTS
jgi:hypothetical protein